MATRSWSCVLLTVSWIYHTTGAFNSAQEYFNKWKTTEFRDMAPFGTEYYDSTSKTLSSIDLQVDFPITFYGRTYNKALVLPYGAISLSAETGGYLLSTKLPNPKYDGTVQNPDPALIAAYYAETYMIQSDISQLNYRLVNPNKETPGTVRYEVAVAMLAMAQREVMWAMVGAVGFIPDRLIVVTWQDVTFYCKSPCPRNTFQAVVATGGNQTYVIYNYHKTTWENSPLERCDPNTGLTTSSNPNCFSAQAGFNAGGGREFYSLPFSNTPNVVKLAGMGNGGKFVFKVSGEKIHRGECLPNNNQDHPWWPVEVWPQTVSMLGGQVLHISGPCLAPTDAVVCRFGKDQGIEVQGQVVDEMRAACIMPMIPYTGELQIDLLVNSQPTPYGSANITIEHPGRLEMPVQLTNEDWWGELEDYSLTVTWDPRSLLLPVYNQSVINNTSSAYDVTVDVALYGYNETQGQGQPKIEWKMLTILGTSEENDGEFMFKPSQHRCDPTVQPDPCDWHIGAIKVFRSGQDPNNMHGIFTKPVPLQWYIKDAMMGKHGEDWPRAKCEEWLGSLDQERMEEEDDKWTNELPPCPCLFNQALADYIWLPDFECNFTDPQPCPLQPNAHMCFIPVNASMQGGSSRCCYDKSGYLIYSGDNNAGSYSHKAHIDGLHPYNTPGKVPHLSNWFHDKMPYMLCCKWATNKDLCYDQFLLKRPTPDCKRHKPSTHGSAFGDPHFITFDGTAYTFNPHGEFWLIRVEGQQNIPDFKLQARMIIPIWPEMSLSLPYNTENMNATVMTSVVMAEGNVAHSPKVEFRLNPPYSPTKVSVLVNGQVQNFLDVRRIEFWGKESESLQRVVIQTEGKPDPSTKQFNNFTVIFSSHVAVRVSGKNGLLQVAVNLPRQYFKVPRGLFGGWTGEKDKDLINRNGEVVEPISNEHIHKNFGMTWETTTSESLFTYLGNMTWNYFSERNFQPYFELEDIHGPGPSETELQQTCDDNFVCRFDFKTILNPNIAADSRQTEAYMYSVAELGAEVPSCEHLMVAHVKDVERSAGYYLPDGAISFISCQEGYSLQGHTQYQCVLSGGMAEWRPHPDVKCKSNAEIAGEKSRLAAAIAVPICLAFLIAVIIGGLIFMRKRKPHDKDTHGGEDKTASDIVKSDHPPDFKHSRLSFLPNPMSLLKKTDDVNNSTSSLGSRVSQSSIVLTQDLPTARPPRPKETQPKLTRSSRASYGNPVQMEDGSVRPADTEGPVRSQTESHGQPVTNGYDNPAIAGSQENLQLTRQYPYQGRDAPLTASQENLQQPRQYPYQGREAHLTSSKENLAAPVQYPYRPQDYEPEQSHSPSQPQYPYKPSDSEA